MTKHTHARIAAALLALLLALLAVTPVLAESATNYTIRINPSETTKVPEAPDYAGGERFEAYAIFVGDLAFSDGNNHPADGLGGATFDYDYSEDGAPVSNFLANVKWGSAIPESARAAFVISLLAEVTDFSAALQAGLTERGLDETGYSSDAAAEAIAYALEANPTFIDSFARLAWKVIDALEKGNPGSVEKTSSTWVASEDTATDPYGGHWEIQTPNAGFYLIRDTLVTTDDPGTDDDTASAFMMGVYGNQNVDLKPDHPDVDKVIVSPDGEQKGDIAGMTDRVSFRLKGGPLPLNYEQYDSPYFFAFHDALSKGLTLLPDTIHVYAINGVDPDQTKVEIPSNFYSINYSETDQDTGATLLHIIFDNLKSVTGDGVVLEANSSIWVEYDAIVNENAVITEAGNPNDVYLEYSNNPSNDSRGNTTHKDVYVYDFALQIHKVGDDDPDTGLKGAGFTLTKKDGERTLTAIFGTNEAGELCITDWVEDLTGYTEDQYTLSTDDAGEFNFHGLDSGVEYTLTETKTPSGYNTMAPIVFYIEASYDENGKLIPDPKIVVEAREDVVLNGSEADGSLGSIPIFPEGEENELQGDLTLVNNKAPFLPGTGGIGRTIFYVAGALLLIGSLVAVLVVGYKKAKKKN